MPLVTPTREDLLVAWFAALAMTVHVAEAALPAPLPGFKPGLANVITILVLLRYGWTMAAWVSGLRVLASSLVLGTFLTPTFVLSLSGAVAVLLVFWLATRLPGRGFGPIGYSVLAAMAHMGAQLLSAWALFIPHPGLWNLAPVLLTAAILFGMVNGLMVIYILRIWPEASTPPAEDEGRAAH